jgi:hypothetical protein
VLAKAAFQDHAMSLEDAYLVSQIVAAIALVASLAFVGVQLRQNTRSVRAATSTAHSDLLIQLGVFTAGTDDAAHIWRSGLQGLDHLTENERVRFTVLLTTLMRFFESSRVQWLHGQLDKEHWHSVEQQAMGLATQPGVKAWWLVRSHWHSAEFRNWFESIEGVSGDFRFYGDQAGDQPK